MVDDNYSEIINMERIVCNNLFEPKNTENQDIKE